MKIRAIGLLTAIAAATLFLVPGAAGAQGRGRGPMHYDVAAEVTINGTVDDIKQGPQRGTHVMLKTADGTMEIALGPTWYQTEKKYSVAKGDQLEVIGAKSQTDGRDVLLAREIKKGTETMTFRDAKGFPMWAGRGRR